MDLEEVWRIREEKIYPTLFGGEQRGIFTLSSELIALFEFAPTPQRPFWLYVTSGHSNPWHEESDGYDPASQSGAGIEFIFASAERGDWATQCLQNLLAFDLLLDVGHFPGGQPLTEGDRIPIRSPINGKENCLIRNVILSRPASLPTGFQLPSGQVDLLTLQGSPIVNWPSQRRMAPRLSSTGCNPLGSFR